MKYLKQFNTHSEYEQYIGGGSLEFPNVSTCKDFPKHVHYMPRKSQPNNEIWYTTTDESILNPYDYSKHDMTHIGPEIISNTYDNGKGVLKFDGDVTVVGMIGEEQKYYVVFNGMFESHTLKTISLPSTVTTVHSSFVFAQTNLETISCSWDNITTLGQASFSGCTKLNEFIIGSSITEIPGMCFGGCAALTEITIPASVTSIGEQAFNSCVSLESVTVLATVPPTLGSYAFSNMKEDSHIYVPANSIDAYRADPGWSEYDRWLTPMN